MDGPTKRKDVGYKRPPIERRFSKVNQPAKRKKKVADLDRSGLDLLNKILSEPQKVVVNGAVFWMSTAEAIVRKAVQLVEAGNRTLRRPIENLLMAVNKERYDRSKSPHIIVGGADTGPMLECPDDVDWKFD